jgi:hypothetical protein
MCLRSPATGTGPAAAAAAAAAAAEPAGEAGPALLSAAAAAAAEEVGPARPFCSGVPSDGDRSSERLSSELSFSLSTCGQQQRHNRDSACGGEVAGTQNEVRRPTAWSTKPVNEETDLERLLEVSLVRQALLLVRANDLQAGAGREASEDTRFSGRGPQKVWPSSGLD